MVDRADTQHGEALARAFDGQAARFEKAPVQTDPQAMGQLVAFAELGEFAGAARVLDAGCGPGLVARAFLESGAAVHGVDLSPEMIARARARCAPFGERASFDVGSVFDARLDGQAFDAVVSRYVIHHVLDAGAFVRRLAALARPGGVVLVSDHTTDPDDARAAWHQRIEIGRDQTHTRNLTPGTFVDLFAAAGLEEIRAREEPFTLDFDEWFDRGTPSRAKDDVRREVLSGSARGFAPTSHLGPARPPAGAPTPIGIDCVRVLVRGRKR